jgi:hypothetical protein
MQGPDATSDEWVSVTADRQASLTPAAKRKAERKAAAAAERAERVSSSSTERPVLEAVDIDALTTPVIPVRTLIQPVIPWVARKKQRPAALEWVSAPQHAPRNRNIDDWLKDDSQHRPVSPVVSEAAVSGAASSRRGDEVGVHHLKEY